MFSELFKPLGILHNEASLYVLLLRNGRAGAQILAKRAGLPRTTVYSSLRTLEEKGLVVKHQAEHHTVFSARSPETLLELIQEEQKEIKRKKTQTNKLVNLLRPMMQQVNYSIPEMQFIEGRGAVNRCLYERFANWQLSMQQYDRTWWGFHDHSYLSEFGEALSFHLDHWKEGDHVKLFSNESEAETSYSQRVKSRQIKPFPFDIEFDSSLWIAGDFIIFLQCRSAPFYLVEIEDGKLELLTTP